MMLSKITWIAFLGALCFRISESVLIKNKPVECDTDIHFLEEMLKHKLTSVPVLITTEENRAADENIKRLLQKSPLTYQTLIKVFVDGDKCPVTKANFPFNGPYPALFIVRNEQKFNEAFLWATSGPLNEFLTRASNAPLGNATVRVTETIDKSIVGHPTLEDCHTDEQCRNLLSNYSLTDVPVLITKDEHIDVNDTIKRYFRKKRYEILIRVFVENNKCPVTNDVFLSGGKFPALFILKRDNVFNGVCHDFYETYLDMFFRQITIPKPDMYITTNVSRVIENRIAVRQQAALLALAQSVEREYWAATVDYSAQSVDYSAQSGLPSGYASGSPSGYASGWPSGYASGSPSGYASGSPSGYASGLPSGYASGLPSGYASGSPSGYASSGRQTYSAVGQSSGAGRQTYSAVGQSSGAGRQTYSAVGQSSGAGRGMFRGGPSAAGSSGAPPAVSSRNPGAPPNAMEYQQRKRDAVSPDSYQGPQQRMRTVGDFRNTRTQQQQNTNKPSPPPPPPSR